MKTFNYINGMQRRYTEDKISQLVHMEPEDAIQLKCNICGESLTAYSVSIAPGSSTPAIYVDPCEYCNEN